MKIINQKKKKKSKSNDKQVPKNVSFNSNIIVNNGSNEKQIKESDNYKYKIRLNSDDNEDRKKNEKKKKALEILKTSPILSIEEKMKNLNNNYSSNLTQQENEKKTNIKSINKLLKNNRSSSLDSSEYSNNNSKSYSNSDNENIKLIFPSHTSQIGINFLSKEKEEEIYNNNSNEAKTICESIYILLEEESQFEENNDVKTLFKFLFETFNVDCIKNLFFKVIYQKVYVSKNIDKGISNIFQRLLSKHIKEFKLICKAKNEPLSWLTMNILEIDKYFQLVYDK